MGKISIKNVASVSGNGVKKKTSPVGKSNGLSKSASKLPIQKTYKLYIDGKFPRTESGRYFPLNKKSGEHIANICRGSRKDFREAVVAARKAQPGWGSMAVLTRGQILYRIGEMLEGRSSQFIGELIDMGNSQADAEKEFFASVDRIIHYAGWADKYQQLFSTVNPVASSHFNFSMLEPSGVVSIIGPEKPGLLGMISVIIPAICGGNSVVYLASASSPLSAISFAEVLHSSDVPGGVVNILTGYRSELLGHFTTHMDVNSSVLCSDSKEEITTAEKNSSGNVKRIITYSGKDWFSPESQSPYFILDLQETKTTWHPVGI